MKMKLFIFFIVIQTLMFFLVYSNGKLQKEDLLKQKTKNMQRQYKSINNYLDKMADTVFEGYINNKEIINIFAKKHRDKLYNTLYNKYSYLKSVDIAQLQFHLKDNTSFLRMHKPEFYGDDLSKIRYSIQYVNKNKKKISGIEIGRIQPGFRYVYPLFDGNNYLGSVENSFSIMAFIHQLESLYKIHTHFLLYKDLVNSKILHSNKSIFTDAVEHKDFYKLNTENCNVGYNKKTTKAKLFNGIYKKIVEKNIKLHRAFSFEFIINGITKINTFLPVLNIKNEQIGYFVLYYKDNDLLTLNKNITKRYAIFGVVITLLFIVLYKILSQRDMLTKEVKKQTRQLHNANRSLGLKTKELNRLNNSLEDKVKDEVDKNRQKDFELMEASKMVQMGEMIANIAHQWRQPLSMISTVATGIIATREMGILDDESLVKDMNQINDASQYLSETINTFRDFIKEEKVLKEQMLEENISSALNIVGTVLKDVNIKLIDKIDYNQPTKITMVSGELPQVVINIINNAKDILLEQEKEDKWVEISLDVLKDKAIITIEDNAGGVPDDIILKIFEPYFTTKHQSIGTGLGLHMSRKIIVESLHGKLYVKNSQNGAKFFIELPLTNDL